MLCQPRAGGPGGAGGVPDPGRVQGEGVAWPQTQAHPGVQANPGCSDGHAVEPGSPPEELALAMAMGLLSGLLVLRAVASSPLCLMLLSQWETMAGGTTRPYRMAQKLEGAVGSSPGQRVPPLLPVSHHLPVSHSFTSLGPICTIQLYHYPRWITSLTCHEDNIVKKTNIPEMMRSAP